MSSDQGKGIPMRALLVLIACSFAVAACDSSDGAVVAPTAPTARVILTPAPPTAVVSYGSQSNLQLVISAPSAPVTLSNVTIHLITGENIGGGNMVTFPQANLTSLFGSTVVFPGRTFFFNPPFVCSGLQPCTIRTDATIVDASGNQRVITSYTAMR